MTSFANVNLGKADYNQCHYPDTPPSYGACAETLVASLIFRNPRPSNP